MDTLTPVVLAFIPILFYLILVFFTTPINFNVKRFINYFIFGVCSVGGLLVFKRVFPNIQDTITFPFPIFGGNVDDILFFVFVQIGLIEESGKFLFFKLCKSMDKTKITLIDIMIYSGVVGLGFSFVENIFYMIDYGSDTLTLRAITATILHLVCGFIMGYFIALGRTKQTDKSTLINYFLYKHPKLKPILYSFAGVMSAMFLHGLYDYNALSNTSSVIILMFIILTLGVTLSYMMSRDLISKMMSPSKPSNIDDY